MTATRTAVVWVPDWPVLAAMTAARVPAHTPAAVCDAHRVVAVSSTARAHGVRRGMRRRRAQELSPEIVVLAPDDGRDVREFEPVAVAAETVVAGVEIARPGLLLLPSDGPSRYHGSERTLAEALVSAVAAGSGYECQVGIADGMLAAVLAARGDGVVDPGESPTFLAPRPVVDLVHAAAGGSIEVRAVTNLAHLLARLGVHTLGALTALPADSVHDRFGALGHWAHRMAAGADLRPPVRRRADADVSVSTVLDPPAERVDVAAFAARRLAEELHALLVRSSASAGLLRIGARTEAGAELERTWRCGDDAMGGLSAARITERVRWQLEGWITGSAVHGTPTGNIVELSVSAEEVVPAGAHQPRLWGASSGEEHRARRALGRVQGLLGGDAVLAVELQGGRDVRDQVHLVPFNEQAPPARNPAHPWPGRLPDPSPATVLPIPQEVAVLDATGHPVVVDARLLMSGAPAVIRTPGEDTDPDEAAGEAVRHRQEARRVRDWAGPWPVVERWWTSTPRRRVYLQVVLNDAHGLLLACTQGQWTVEAVYD